MNVTHYYSQYKSILVLTITLFLTRLLSNSYGALIWEEKEKNISVSLMDTSIVTEFIFQNKGSNIVTITNLFSSCGCCTTSDLKKRTYLPGETGSISVAFQFGDRVGAQNKSIWVTTTDTGSDTILKLKTFIPEAIHITPQFLFWSNGEDLVEKTIQIVVTNQPEVIITEVDTSNEKLFPTLKSPKNGIYQLIVKPDSTEIPAKAMLRLYVQIKPNLKKTFKAFAEIK